MKYAAPVGYIRACKHTLVVQDSEMLKKTLPQFARELHSHGCPCWRIGPNRYLGATPRGGSALAARLESNSRRVDCDGHRWVYSNILPRGYLRTANATAGSHSFEGCIADRSVHPVLSVGCGFQLHLGHHLPGLDPVRRAVHCGCQVFLFHGMLWQSEGLWSHHPVHEGGSAGVV